MFKGMFKKKDNKATNAKPAAASTSSSQPPATSTTKTDTKPTETKPEAPAAQAAPAAATTGAATTTSATKAEEPKPADPSLLASTDNRALDNADDITLPKESSGQKNTPTGPAATTTLPAAAAPAVGSAEKPTTTTTGAAETTTAGLQDTKPLPEHKPAPGMSATSGPLSDDHEFFTPSEEKTAGPLDTGAPAVPAVHEPAAATATETAPHAETTAATGNAPTTANETVVPETK